MKIRIVNKDGSRCGLDFMSLIALFIFAGWVCLIAWFAGRWAHHEQIEELHSMPTTLALPDQLPRSYSEENGDE